MQLSCHSTDNQRATLVAALCFLKWPRLLRSATAVKGLAERRGCSGTRRATRQKGRQKDRGMRGTEEADEGSFDQCGSSGCPVPCPEQPRSLGRPPFSWGDGDTEHTQEQTNEQTGQEKRRQPPWTKGSAALAVCLACLPLPLRLCADFPLAVWLPAQRVARAGPNDGQQ
jgi:hypothetical protein